MNHRARLQAAPTFNPMTAYYNEIDKYCAAWLRNLIGAGLIARGDVDERDIREVRANEIRKYTQCHFFAGIGGWSRALRLAQWDDATPVWTGSCPCQPFSAAGKQRGKTDERHLWPEWFRLIRECRPPIIFGEQVAAAIAFGWLDEAAYDLEGEGYAVAASVLPACAVVQPHRRDRLWFVADSAGSRIGGRQRNVHQTDGRQVGECLRQPRGPSEIALGDAYRQRLQESGELQRSLHPKEDSPQEANQPLHASAMSIDWIGCPDGKSRPVKPGIRLLANGVPARVGKLRAYGNAIVPQLAAEFIRAARRK